MGVPQLLPVGHAQQGDLDADTRPPALHAPLEHMRDLEGGPDGGEIVGLAAEGIARCAGRHLQRAQPSEGADHFVGNAVGEEGVVGILSDIGEGEDRDRGEGGRGGGRHGGGGAREFLREGAGGREPVGRVAGQ